MQLTKDTIKDLLLTQGFDVVACVSAADMPNISKTLIPWLEAGYHGDLGWMVNNAQKRADPRILMPEARSAFMVGLNYAPDTDPRHDLAFPDKAVISVYAQNEDYHDVMKKRLKQASVILNEMFGLHIRLFVDTAPLHEKTLAQKAGLGWQGKHTNLVSREFGSWLFLGAILCDAEFDSDKPEIDHCGSCRKCLVACPTNAFTQSYMLDARKCISYLTIEYKGLLPRLLGRQMGNHIYGCDDCLSVCPWNKFAKTSAEIAFHAQESLKNPPLMMLLDLNDIDFKRLFRKSPIKRIGYIRFMRNILNAVGNTALSIYKEKVEKYRDNDSELLRATSYRTYYDIMGGDIFENYISTPKMMENSILVVNEIKNIHKEIVKNDRTKQ